MRTFVYCPADTISTPCVRCPTLPESQGSFHAQASRSGLQSIRRVPCVSELWSFGNDRVISTQLIYVNMRRCCPELFCTIICEAQATHHFPSWQVTEEHLNRRTVFTSLGECCLPDAVNPSRLIKQCECQAARNGAHQAGLRRSGEPRAIECRQACTRPHHVMHAIGHCRRDRRHGQTKRHRSQGIARRQRVVRPSTQVSACDGR